MKCTNIKIGQTASPLRLQMPSITCTIPLIRKAFHSGNRNTIRCPFPPPIQTPIPSASYLLDKKAKIKMLPYIPMRFAKLLPKELKCAAPPKAPRFLKQESLIFLQN